METDQAEWQRLRVAFDEALQNERGSMNPTTPRLVPDDPTLRMEIDELLQHLERAKDLLSSDQDEASSLFQPGHVLSDRYRIVSHLGSGGMSDVYEVEDQHLHELVALKALHLEGGNPSLAVELLRREVRNARKVVHPNVCRNYDIGYDQDQGEIFAYLTMERLYGETLTAHLKRSTRLSVNDAVQLAKQMCDGLHAAHAQGIVHGDLKPQNIFVTAEEQRLVILDFGLSRQSKNLELTTSVVSRMCAGTPAYLAPERFAGHAASFASDLYSVGIILRDIVGAALSSGEAIPVGWTHAIESCLQTDPSQRPLSAQHLFELLSGERTTRRGWTLAILFAAATIGALGLWGWGMHRHSNASSAHASVSMGLNHPGANEYLQTGSSYLGRQTRRSIDESINAFRTGLALDPSNTVGEARFARALTRKYEMTKDPQYLAEAAKVLAPAKMLAPDSGEVLLTAGMLERDHGHLGEAIAQLKKSVAIDRTNGETWKQMAITFDRSGDVLGAQGAYEQGIAADPSNWSLYTDFGLFYYAHGQFQRAETQLLTARSLAPDSPAVFADLGGLYLAEGRLEEARSTLARALDLEPSAAVSMNLGSVYLRMGKIAEAVRLYRKACDLSPDDYRMWTNLGSGYKRLANEAEASRAYTKAIAILHRSLEVSPNDPYLLSDLSLYSAVNGNAVEARAVAEKAIQVASQNPRVYMQAATMEELLGARQDALRYLERAFELGASVEEVEGITELAALRSDPAFRKMTMR